MNKYRRKPSEKFLALARANHRSVAEHRECVSNRHNTLRFCPCKRRIWPNELCTAAATAKRQPTKFLKRKATPVYRLVCLLCFSFCAIFFGRTTCTGSCSNKQSEPCAFSTDSLCRSHTRIIASKIMCGHNNFCWRKHCCHDCCMCHSHVSIACIRQTIRTIFKMHQRQRTHGSWIGATGTHRFRWIITQFDSYATDWSTVDGKQYNWCDAVLLSSCGF